MNWTSDALKVGTSDSELDQLLSAELTAFNVAATGEDNQQSLSVRAVDDNGGVAGGLMGWTWAACAGIELLWVRANHRGGGLGRELMTAAEDEARRRGCAQVLVRSFTFQAPEFYRKLGYVEYARSDALPTTGHADIHFRKNL